MPDGHTKLRGKVIRRMYYGDAYFYDVEVGLDHPLEVKEESAGRRDVRNGRRDRGLLGSGGGQRGDRLMVSEAVNLEARAERAESRRVSLIGLPRTCI